MIISCVAIFFKLSYHETHLLKRETPISVSHKKRITKMLFMILVTFVFLRLPFTLLVFMRQQKLQQSQMNQLDGSFYLLWYISHYMIFVNAAVNPVIYGLMNGNFKRAFSQTKFCCLDCRNGQSQSGKGQEQGNIRFVFYEEPLKVHLEPRDACVSFERQKT